MTFRTPKAYYNELDPFAAQWLRNLIAANLIAPGDVDERDIRDILPSDLAGYTQCHFFAGIGGWSYAARLAGWPDSRPLWTGSCPCQPFSAAGKRTGMSDERHLWPAFFHLIEHGKPRDVPVFGEQVASPDGLAWLDLVQADLEGAGYACWAADICATGFGAPIIRQRLWWVACAEVSGWGAGIRSNDAWELDSEGSGSTSGMACAEPANGRAEYDSKSIPHGWDGLRGGGSALRLASTDLAQRGSSVARGNLLNGSTTGRYQGDSELGTGGDDCRLALASSTGPLPCAHGGIRSSEESARSRDAELERFGTTGRLARSPSGRRGEERPYDGRDLGGDRAQGDAAGLVSGSDDERLGQSELSTFARLGRDGRQGLRLESTEGPARGSMADGLQQSLGNSRLLQGPIPSNLRPGPTNGFWHRPDWLLCRDERWRPVESGTFPLAHGVPNRVGRQRGYGNAINAQAAAHFLAAVLECLPPPPSF